MTRLSNMIGLDAKRLVPTRRLVIGLAILLLTPALIVIDWAATSPLAAL